MALLTCPDCKKEISDSAPVCPNCGKPFKRDYIGIVTLFLSLITPILLLFLTFMANQKIEFIKTDLNKNYVMYQNMIKTQDELVEAFSDFASYTEGIRNKYGLKEWPKKAITIPVTEKEYDAINFYTQKINKLLLFLYMTASDDDWKDILDSIPSEVQGLDDRKFSIITAIRKIRFPGTIYGERKNIKIIKLPPAP